jgi:hypothetical protein
MNLDLDPINGHNAIVIQSQYLLTLISAVLLTHYAIQLNQQMLLQLLSSGMWQHAMSRLVPKVAIYGTLSEQNAVYLPKVKVMLHPPH